MASAAGASTCSAAVYKLAPFMQQPAPADNIYELLDPVWWVMDGKSLGSYPLGPWVGELVNYARHNGKAPIAGITALCALVLLSLVFFVLWRFVRCVKVVCCQQEAYADANKVLFSKRLRVLKGLTFALSLLACGAAAWGMISLNKNILPDMNARIDSMQEFPAKIVQQVSSLANETAALHAPLSNISSVVNSVDVDGIRGDLTCVTAFLKEAPSPAVLLATLQRLQTALKPELFEGLRQLHGLINVASESSSLARLKGYLDTLASFDISVMAPAIRSYSNAVNDLYRLVHSRRTNEEVQASRELARLRASYDQLDLDAWVPYLDQAVATATAINSMRTPASNPFTLTIQTLQGVEGTVADIRGNMLDSLSATVKQFNGLWHNNASVAFESLLHRAAHLNHTVLELPREVESKVLLVNASVTDFMKLYNGQDSLLTLPQRIKEAGAKLSMPDASRLISELKLAESQLNDANGLPELIAKLATLARALDQTLRDAKSNIQPSLNAFAADDSMRMDLADTLTFEGPVVLGAASLFESADIGGFKDVFKAVLAKLDAVLEPARREADAIPGVLKQISDFDVISKFMGPLQQAEAVYKEFNGNPADLTKPVFEMLDRVSAIGTNDLASAQELVANVSSSVQKMSDSIQSATVDRIDSFQSSYLGKAANSSAQAAGSSKSNLVKAVHAVYYAFLGSYAVIIGLILLVVLFTLLNCPAGVCFGGFLLNTALLIFSAVPLLITVGLLITRDTCGNMEAIASKAVAQKAGNSSLPAAVSQFYLSANPANSSAGGLPAVIKGINADYDVEGFKARVQRTVDDMLKGVTDDFTLRPQVSSVVDDATSRINALLDSMDSVLLTLDHSSVSNVYSQGKSFFCCSLANQVYKQWAATITVIALAWVAMQCALRVLSKLDTLSERCCRFRPYRSKDYGPGNGPITSPRKGDGLLTPRKGRAPAPLAPMDSNSSETVAVISLGGSALGAAAAQASSAPVKGNTAAAVAAAPAGGSKASFDDGTGGSSELPQCTPLPPPLTLRTVPPAAVLASPRGAAAPARLGGDAAADGQRRQQHGSSAAQTAAPAQQPSHHQQQQRRPRVGEGRPAISITAVYPTVIPALPGSPSALQREQQQQQQQWAAVPGGMPGKGLVRGPCTRI